LRVYHRAKVGHTTNGILTLYDTPFQGIYAWSKAENTSLDYNSGTEGTRFKI
jgi:hypothetical protein